MYGMLGTVMFDLLTAPSSFDETHEATYAEHATIEGKPKLQATGNALIEYNFTLKLHHTIADVESTYQSLLSAQSSQKAQALIFGFSDYRGDFVITSIRAQTLITDDYGQVLARELQVSLKEFVGETAENPLGEALQLGGVFPLGSILPAGVVNAISTVRDVVNKGIQTYKTVMRVVDTVRSAFLMIDKVIHNPALALGYLPGIIGGLGNVMGQMAGLFSGTAIFTSIATVLPIAQSFANQMMGVYQDVAGLYMGVRNIFDMGAYSDRSWLDLSFDKIATIDEKLENLSAPAAKMTAWIALRDDDEVTYEPALS